MNPAESEAQVRWGDFHAVRLARRHVYPTEWVVRTLAGGNYPDLKLNRQDYVDAKILDSSCGDGRNLSLLEDLGFDVHATEITPDVVTLLETKKMEMGWNTEFRRGKNGNQPYADGFFDYVLSCASCYYLDEEKSFDSTIAEFFRILKPGGYLIASIPDEENFAAQGAASFPDGSILISNDPFGLRNGTRWMIVRNRDQLRKLLSPYFEDVHIGHLMDDYYGLTVSGYIFVCRKSR